MRAQIHSSLKPPLEYNQDQLPVTNQGLTILGVTEILCSFKLVCERKTNKRISESSRLKFLEKFLGNNFALSDAKGNTAGLIDKGGIVDVPLFRRLLTICQKS